MTRKLLLIRHGEIEEAFQGRLIGSTDVGLSSQGKKEAKNLAPLFTIHPPDLCLTSPLRRAVMTAETALSQTPFSAGSDPDLRETDFGSWENRTFQEIAALDPARVEEWAALSPDFQFPEGETISAMLERVHGAADRLIQQDASTIAVFSHGGPIGFMICYLTGLSYHHHLLFRIRRGGVAILDLFDSKATLTGLINPDFMEKTGSMKEAAWARSF